VRFAFIRGEKANHGVALLCRTLEVSRQEFYYAWLGRKPLPRSCERYDAQVRSLGRTRLSHSSALLREGILGASPTAWAVHPGG
jgi:hypothetical protein